MQEKLQVAMAVDNEYPCLPTPLFSLTVSSF